MRGEVRLQLSALPDEMFETQFPDWEHLPEEHRQQKMLIARDELLKVLDRAGYQVTKKKVIE